MICTCVLSGIVSASSHFPRHIPCNVVSQRVICNLRCLRSFFQIMSTFVMLACCRRKRGLGFPIPYGPKSLRSSIRDGTSSLSDKVVSTSSIFSGTDSPIIFLQYVSNLSNSVSICFMSTVSHHACSCPPYLSSTSSLSFSISTTLK